MSAPIPDEAVEAAACSVGFLLPSDELVYQWQERTARAVLEVALPFLTAEKDANTGEPSNERIPELVEGLMAQRDEALAEVERWTQGAERLTEAAATAAHAAGVAEGVAKVKTAWDEGRDTALNFAKRNPDGITLRLEVANPYIAAVEGDAS